MTKKTSVLAIAALSLNVLSFAQAAKAEGRSALPLNPLVYADAPKVLEIQSLASMAPNGNSDLFGFFSAKESFTNAAVPTVDQLVGHWIAVGAAEIPSAADTDLFNVSPGYYPDGKYSSSGSVGYFRNEAQFESKTDIFGKDQLTFSLKIIGNESHKVYEQQGPVGVEITAEAGRFVVPSYNTDGTANDLSIAHYEINCRLAQTADHKTLLLCSEILNGSGEGVSEDYTRYFGEVVAYTAFSHL